MLSLIALELTFAPVLYRPIRIKDPFDVTIQRPHDADSGQHRRAATLYNEGSC
jgi:hypothetical protein